MLDPGFPEALLHMIVKGTSPSSASLETVEAIIVRVYMVGDSPEKDPLTEKDLQIRFDQLLQDSENVLPESIAVSSVTSSRSERSRRSNKARSDIITKIRSDSKKALQRFLVADIETILNEKKEHVAYAVGVMKVDPEDEGWC